VNKKQRINVITLGCSKNIVDSEVFMRQAEPFYNVETDSDNNADIIVINTCGFINDAKEESIETILAAVEAKKRGDVKKVIVTGCLSQRYKSELENEIAEVDGFFGVNDLPQILASLNIDYKKELIGERHISTPSHYAYLKISEGCDRNCSFCAIPMIRGKHVSRTMESLLEEARFLAGKGVKELILIAQDLTYYGIDIYGKRKLPELVEKLTSVNGIEWIRLHYAYPAGFPWELTDVVAKHDKVCNYLDIPLQHINDRILKSMKRGLDGKGTREFVNKIRKSVPGIAFRTTMIVGYPGETEKEFQELYDFVKENRFDRLGVFTYSPEEGTGAFNLTDDVPDDIKQERLERLMELQQNISLENNMRKTGQILKVIIDKREGDFFVGRSEFDSPEVDQEILIPAKDNMLKTGEFYNVKITKADYFDLYGEILTAP
jgi:ribosomal protein S12 methylthiotransferase